MKMQNQKYKFSAKCSGGFLALSVLYVSAVQARDLNAGDVLSLNQ